MQRLRLLILWGMACGHCFAQAPMTEAQLVSFIKSSIQQHNSDKDVADFVAKLKVTTRLEAQTVEALQAAGAGPRTVTALKKLSAASATLPAAPPPAPKITVGTLPPPPSVEQKQILDQLAEHARNYTANLPNFICTQVTRKHEDPTGTENFSLAETVQEQLTYFNREESYKVTMVNGAAVTNVEHSQLGGATSSGEFGTMLRYVFEPSSHAEFDWERWTTLRGHRMYVFNFKVNQAFSRYSITDRDTHRTIIAGYQGLIYADSETKSVMRILMQADSLPAGFPIQKLSLDLNYDLAKIGDQEFLLPLKSELRSTRGKYLSWNETEFRVYRKFGTESSITFDAAKPIPDDQLREQPIKKP